MTKEAQEKIDQIISAFLSRIDDETGTVRRYAESIGYHKLPEGEPPLLSDEKIIETKVWYQRGIPFIEERDRKVAQAQRKSDIEFYIGGKE